MAIMQANDQIPALVTVGTFSYDQLSKRNELDTFYKSLKQMIYGSAYLLQEKFWDMGVYNPKCKFLATLKKWFTENTLMKTVKDLAEDDFLRLIISYTMAVDPSQWLPAPLQFPSHAEEIPMPELIFNIWLAMLPYNGVIEGQPFESNILSLIPFPVWEGEIQKDQGKQRAFPAITPPEPAHSKGITAHSEAITATEKLKKNAKAPDANKDGDASQSVAIATQMQTLLDGMHSMQLSLATQAAKISTLEHAKRPSPHAQAFVHNPYSRPATSAEPNGIILNPAEPYGGSHNAMGLELVKVIQNLTEKKKAKESHIAKAWEETVLPRVTAERLVKTHDYSQNTYGQRAAVVSAKSLLQLYELSLKHDPPNVSNPNSIAPDSPYHPLAVQQTEAIQDSLMAHAFPTNDKPLQKERKQLLAAVMGPDLSSKDLADAYKFDGYNPNYRGRGRGGRGYRGRGRGRNDNYRGRGRGRGRSQGRGQDPAEDP